RVDDHLPVDGTGDLDATIEDVARQRRALPVALANALGLGQEVETLALREPRVTLFARREALFDARPEGPDEVGDELEGGARQDRGALAGGRPEDAHARRHVELLCHQPSSDRPGAAFCFTR